MSLPVTSVLVRPFLKSAGESALPHASTRLLANGTLPDPSPWHDPQVFSNNPRPRSTDSVVAAGSGAMVIGVPGFSFRHRAENVWTYAMTSARSAGASA